MESFKSLLISKVDNLFQNFIADLQAIYAKILFFTSSKVFDLLNLCSQISCKTCKKVSFKFSFFIKSGIQFIIILFQAKISISNHISLKVSILSSNMSISWLDKVIFSPIRSH
jgi:hypothetical protein